MKCLRCMPHNLGHTPFVFPLKNKIKTIRPGVKRQGAIRARSVSLQTLVSLKVPWNEDTEWWGGWSTGQRGRSAASCCCWGRSCCGVGAAVLAFPLVPLATPPPAAASRLWLESRENKHLIRTSINKHVCMPLTTPPSPRPVEAEAHPPRVSDLH